MSDQLDWNDLLNQQQQPQAPSPRAAPGSSAPVKWDDLVQGVESMTDTYSSLVAPLQIPQQLLFGAATGQLPQVLRNVPKLLKAPFASVGSKPPKIITGQDVAQYFGVADERTSFWVGLGLDFLADPLMAAGWVRGVGTAAIKAGLSTPQAVDKAVEVTRQATSLSGIVNAFKAVAPGPARTVQAFAERIYEMPTPLPLPGVAGRVRAVEGIPPEQLRANVREALFPQGVAPGARRMGEGGTVLPEAFTGSEKVGPGFAQIAEGKARLVKHWAVTGVQKVDEALRTVDPRRGGLYKQLDSLVGVFISETGGMPFSDVAAIAAVLQPRPGAVAAVPTVKQLSTLGEAVLPQATKYTDFLESAKKLAQAYKTDEADVIKAFNTASAAMWATATRIGYETSRYKEFASMVEQAASLAGVHPMRAMMHVWQQAGGLNTPVLQSAEANAFRKQLKALMDQDEAFRHVEPEDYIDGIYNGFLGKSFQPYTNREVLEAALRNKDLVPFQQLDPIEFEKVFAAFRPELGNVVRRLIEASPVNVVRTADILDAAKASGIALTPQKARELIGQVSPAAQMTDKLLEQVIAKTGDPVPESTSLYAMRPKAFREKDVEELYKLVGAKESLASMGLFSGAAVRAQEMLQLTFDELQKMGELWDVKDVVANPTGFKRVTIPKDNAAWGPLAGKSIPLPVARELMRISSLPAGARTVPFLRFINMIRKAFLSPFKTAARNTVSNIGILQQADLPVAEILREMPRAKQVLVEYAAEGTHPDIVGAEHLLNLLQDATVSRQLRNTLDDQLLGALQYGPSQGIAQWVERLDAVIDKMATTPPLGWLGTFQAFEDLTRMSVFLAMKKQFLARGVEEAEAVRRAAFLANNATYDNTSVGAAVDIMRRYGIALFPAFTYFTVGRTIRNIYSRPDLVAAQEHTISALAQIALPEQEERQAVTQITTDYWFQNARPIIIPADEEGHYWVLPLNYIFPTAAVNSEGIVDLAGEPLFGGALRPLLDLYYAWQGTREQEGMPTPATAKFRGPIFQSSDTPEQRVLKSVGYLAEAYAPGQARDILDFWNKRLVYYTNPDQADLLETYYARYLDAKPAQLAMRYAGLSSTEVDTTGGITLRAQTKRLEVETEDKLTQLNRQLISAALRGDQVAMDNLTMRIQQVYKEYADKLERVMGGVR